MLHLFRWAVVLTLCSAFGCAYAGSDTTVYICEGKNGKVYTNHPCDVDEQTLTTKSYHNDAPAPSPNQVQQQDSLDRFDKPAPAPLNSNHAPQANSIAAPAPRIAGYQCSVNGKIWIQTDPCPPTRPGSQFVSGINGVDQYGNPIHGATGIMSTNNPVAQQPLSHDELCDRLRKNTPTSDKKQGPSNAYDRDKMRWNEGCR